MSFDEFIQTHPAVLYSPDTSMFLLPYEDNEINVMSKLFRQYDEFEKYVEKYKNTCIKEYEKNRQACSEAEEKKAFIKLMLDTHK